MTERCIWCKAEIEPDPLLNALEIRPRYFCPICIHGYGSLEAGYGLFKRGRQQIGAVKQLLTTGKRDGD